MMLDARTLIHANGHHMAVAAEPLDVAVARILAKSFGPVTSLRRLGRSPEAALPSRRAGVRKVRVHPFSRILIR